MHMPKKSWEKSRRFSYESSEDCMSKVQKIIREGGRGPPPPPVLIRLISYAFICNQGAMPEQIVRITYRTRENFKKISKSLGIMDDFKSGVPRMAYR